MNTPGITVLMPAYNSEKYIAEAIGSVLNQTFTEFELLIINDGSNDKTRQIIQSFNDPRIVLVDQNNQGVAAALNKGLALAKYSYIARIDADDICYPDRLRLQYVFLVSNPEYVIVGSDAEYITETGDHLCDFTCKGHTNDEIIRDIFPYCPFQHSTVMFRREAVMQCGGYPEQAHNFEDHLLWVQLSKYGKFYNLPQALIRYRFNPSSVTIDERWRGKYFRKLKHEIIRKGTITAEEEKILLSIIQKQDTKRIKEGAYHALCGKKWLLNNYQPEKARWHISNSIRANPFRCDNYFLLLVSYFPEKIIHWFHKRTESIT